MEQLGVFAKYWEAGSVKTRLAATVGDQAAGDLFCLFLEMVLRRAAQEFHGQRVLAYSPPERAAEFAELAGEKWLVRPQSSGDLGARMSHYFEAALSSGCDRVVLLGSDSPDLPRGTLAAAFQALESAPVVLGPSEDGGYLIGMSEFIPQLFQDIAWSTGRVYQQTVDLLTSLDIRWRALGTWYDVDEVDDLKRLRHELRNIEDRTSTVTVRLRKKIDEVLC
jgi:rSAM/selenodomain-associated transferase 1